MLAEQSVRRRKEEKREAKSQRAMKMSLGTGCCSWSLKQAEFLLTALMTPTKPLPPKWASRPCSLRALGSSGGYAKLCWSSTTVSSLGGRHDQSGDLSLSCGPRSGQHQCPLLRIFRPGCLRSSQESFPNKRKLLCTGHFTECTCCVPDTHQVRRVSFSLKGRLVWPKHPNSGFYQ